MPLLLLAEALLEEATQLVEVERLERRQLLGRQVPAHLRIAEPVFELLHELERFAFDALEGREECLVERVEIGLAVDAERASHVVEAVERAVVEAHRQGARERHRLLQADLDLALAELEEEGDEHRSREEPSLTA